MTRIGLSIPSTALMRRPASALPPEASALISRMSVPPNRTRAALIGQLVQALKAAGVWALLDALYLLAAHDAQAARLNWIADHFNLVAVNSPTHTVDAGYQTNATGNYLETGFNPATAAGKFSQNSASIGVWSRTNRDELSAAMGQLSSYLLLRVGGSFYANLNRDLAANNTVGVSSSVGFRAAVRPSSALSKSFVDGALAATFPVTSAPPDNLTYVLLARRPDTGGPNLFSTHQLAFAFIGGGLSDAQMAAFYAAVRTYLVGVGAVTA